MDGEARDSRPDDRLVLAVEVGTYTGAVVDGDEHTAVGTALGFA